MIKSRKESWVHQRECSWTGGVCWLVASKVGMLSSQSLGDRAPNLPSQAAFAEVLFPRSLTFPKGITLAEKIPHVTTSKWNKPKREVPTQVSTAPWENAITRPS